MLNATVSNDPKQSLPLLESVESLTLLIESAPIAIVATNEAGEILFVNAKLEEMFGYQRDFLQGQPIELLMPSRFHQTHLNHRAEYVAQPRVRAMGSGLNLVAQRQDGSEFPIEVGLSFLEVDDALVMMGSITDITIRKKSADILEQQVKARTEEIERRRRVADGLRDTLAIVNANRTTDEILTHIVAQAVELFGEVEACALYCFDENQQQLIVKAHQGLPKAYLEQLNSFPQKSINTQLLLDGQTIAVPDIKASLSEANSQVRLRREKLLDQGYRAYLAVPLMMKGNDQGALMLYYPTPRDFSEEEFGLAQTFVDQVALVLENDRLRAQAEQIAVAAERSRLARDLHDSVTQTLFSANVIADVLPRLWERNPDEARRRSDELQQLTRGALAEMRTMLLELRPDKLTEIPLEDLLHQLVDAVIGRARLPIALQIAGDFSTLSPDVQVSLYRIAQEALNNVAKHARATQVVVTLSQVNAHIKLSVQDDGRGFDVDQVNPKSLGLTIMRERVEIIGAQLEIKSEVDQGTQITVIWDGVSQ
ncbi:MAG: PAS domain S-box protein [Chloroflexota bacterium]